MKTQVKINNKEEYILSFNESIYPSKLIKKAVDDFKKHNNIEFNNTFVKISDQRNEEGKKLAYEFFNYLLALKQNEN